MTEQIASQMIKAKVEFDFDSNTSFMLELSGPTIEDICEQIDMIERKVIDWENKNFPPETRLDKMKQFLGFKTYRGERNWNAKKEAQKWINK